MTNTIGGCTSENTGDDAEPKRHPRSVRPASNTNGTMNARNALAEKPRLWRPQRARGPARRHLGALERDVAK